jgi:hypothetical protein
MTTALGVMTTASYDCPSTFHHTGIIIKIHIVAGVQNAVSRRVLNFAADVVARLSSLVLLKQKIEVTVHFKQHFDIN